MKFIKYTTAILCLSVLPSCSILKSASRVPGTFLTALGRTTGMGVSYEEPREPELTDAEKIEEEEAKVY